MTYETPQALRMALEQRLRSRSNETGVALDRLRRRVLFERIVARLEAAESGRWVLKGGMALEVRLHDAARLTKDIDLGLRGEVDDDRALHDRMVSALGVDLDGDGFVLVAARPQELAADGGGHLTWRVKVTASLAGKPFGGIQIDVSPRAHELARTDRMALPNLLDFAGVPAPVVEVVDVHRHAAEKFHAMLRDFGDRENSRVRDLVDLVLLIEHDQLDDERVATEVVQVWAERDGADPPAVLPPLPATWPARYERLADDHDLTTTTFADAVTAVERLWTRLFPTQES
ncbi:MAG TPA: nucleotidyl transferase AbiEii/AbiGii toxin family protein [Acidimicrobiales bacterium]